ncbi:MAG: GNAT family N-acetyltransferase [Oscillospiraceae bacterium]|nr:GNAT family N-acetyltransferase [Oscillospiraceae bacterium]
MSDTARREDIAARKPYAGEISVLRDIYKTVFGKDGEDSFFTLFSGTEHAIVSESSGSPVSMGFLIPVGDFVRGGSFVPCAMLYGIATLFEHRGRGYGAAVTNKLIETAHSLGYRAVILCPTENGLFEYYAKNTKLREYFYIDETVIPANPAAGKNDGPQISRDKMPHEPVALLPTEYINFRERLLIKRPHIRYNVRGATYQKLLCDELGGGLYQIGDSCAVIEAQSQGEVHVKELLVSAHDDADEIAAIIANMFPSANITVRAPVNTFLDSKYAAHRKKRGFGMLSADGDFAPDENAWYGIAFD